MHNFYVIHLVERSVDIVHSSSCFLVTSMIFVFGRTDLRSSYVPFKPLFQLSEDTVYK